MSIAKTIMELIVNTTLLNTVGLQAQTQTVPEAANWSLFEAHG